MCSITTEVKTMFCKSFGLLLLCLFFDATMANPMQGSQKTTCHGKACATSGQAILQKRVQRVKTTAFYEDEEEDDDDGAPMKKPDKRKGTTGASLAQVEVKRDKTVWDEEDEEDSKVSSKTVPPRKRLETFGLSMLQHSMETAKKVRVEEVVEEEEIQKEP
mmetsp:Transcript_12256/g.23553  ORF Transcript_12256/g.23553 Transcript_12256/m.23553 type:complete len:161 (-) Transcript_12256:317-799(-)